MNTEMNQTCSGHFQADPLQNIVQVATMRGKTLQKVPRGKIRYQISSKECVEFFAAWMLG